MSVSLQHLRNKIVYVQSGGHVGFQAEELTALIDAVQRAYRGGAENDRSVNGNSFCLVCRKWSGEGENHHATDCPGLAFDFSTDAANSHPQSQGKP